jgi:hypothetical protein
VYQQEGNFHEFYEKMNKLGHVDLEGQFLFIKCKKCAGLLFSHLLMEAECEGPGLDMEEVRMVERFYSRMAMFQVYADQVVTKDNRVRCPVVKDGNVCGSKEKNRSELKTHVSCIHGIVLGDSQTPRYPNPNPNASQDALECMV